MADHLRGRGVLVALILVMTPKVVDAVRTGPAPKLDIVGTVLSAAGLGLVVLGVLQSSAWGWIKPKEDSPLTPFGFSLTLFVIGVGAGPAVGVHRSGRVAERAADATRWCTWRC